MSGACESSDGGLPTLTRGLELLEGLVDADGGATAKSLAAELELSRSTCYQILKTLELSGCVVCATVECVRAAGHPREDTDTAAA